MISSLKDIRWVVVAFSICLALMLYQTSYMNLGTITALTSMGLTAFFWFFAISKSGKKGNVPFSLVCFLFFVIASTFVNRIESELWKVVLQIVLCILLFTIRLSNKENEFVKWALLLSMTVYSLLIIIECSTNSSRYFHGDIELFNTVFDPNYIAIPIVCAMTLLIGNIVENNRSIISVLLFAIMAYALMYTASRGAFLGLASGTAVILYYAFFKRGKASMIIPIACFALIAFLLFKYMAVSFEDATSRISDLKDDDIDNGRFAIWQLSMRKLLESPLLGYGVGGNLRVLNIANHNTYVEVLFCTGLFGFVPFMVFLLTLFRKSKRCSALYLAMFISLVVQIFFLDSLSNRCMWLLFGWIAMLPDNRVFDKTMKNTI